MSEFADGVLRGGHPPDVIDTGGVPGAKWLEVVLRPDQLDLIRQIVREELAKADAS